MATKKPRTMPWSVRWPVSLLARVKQLAQADKRSVPAMLNLLVDEACTVRELRGRRAADRGVDSGNGAAVESAAP